LAWQGDPGAVKLLSEGSSSNVIGVSMVLSLLP